MKKRIKKIILNIKENYLLIVIFVLSNTANGLLLKLITTKIDSCLRVSSLLGDISMLLIIGLMVFFFKSKNRRKKYLFIMSIIMTLVCLINSIYYHYYSSFASFSLISNLVFAKDVSDAIFENVLKPLDLIYLWQPIFFYIYSKKKENIICDKRQKECVRYLLLLLVIIMGIGSLLMPINAWGSLYKLWNREAVVKNFGIYIYQFDDMIQSVVPKVNTVFGHDKALRTVKEYYQNNKIDHKKNEYTNIFDGKNIIVIHAESIQKFTMDLSFNGIEVTPKINRLAEEGIFFSNFYAEVGVGTSSDSEFTFNTSLMPSNNGTVFVSYFDRKYIAIPQLLNAKGYYTYSMHANNGDFWNRNVMHKTLGYKDFYSKESYDIDEVIGLGLSDKSFFTQSVQKMKALKDEYGMPFYATLIMLSNHTPFSDLELMEEYPTTTDVLIDGEIVTRDYINNTKLGNYIRSVHYADEAIGLFVDYLENEGLLDNTILVIYGDHDARLDYDDYNLLYNYDPINDIIMTEEDDGYINFNKYEYELNKKVPFIIWSKERIFNKNITIPMGMIDVLPTLGNMVGINSKYQLGTDIMGIKDEDNTVVFTDGSFVTAKMYYNAPKGEIYSLNNEPITEEYIDLRVNHSTEIIDISNDIIYYDLIKELDSE